MMSPTLKGVLCMIAGGALLTMNDAVLKWLTGGYPVGQAMFLRGLFVFIPIGFLVWRAGGLHALRINSTRGHVARAALMICGTFLFISGLARLPLADAIAIAFAGPLFVTALAPPLLGEQVGWRRWSAVLFGFAGILIMVRPTGAAVQWAALLPLGASLTGALRDIVTRRIAFGERSEALLCTSTAAVTLGGLATWPLGWSPVAGGDWGLFALAGMLIGGAHFLMIEALRYAEAAVASPFRYFNLVVAAALGYAIWGDVPDQWTLVGSAFVIASGLYILQRERARFRMGKR